MQPQQHINRFYVKRNAPYLYKWKWSIKVVNNKELKVVSETNLLRESGVDLVNDLTINNNFKVDYNYYIRKAREVVRNLQPEQLSIF